MDWDKIHGNKGFSYWTPLLALSSAAYALGLGVWYRSSGRREQKTLPGFVLSVGNLTAGGTGKTPAVRMLAQWASGEGYRVAVLSRGYGGRYKGKILEVTDGNGLYAGPGEAGDEPFLLAKGLRGVPVVLARERHLAGQWARSKHGSDFFILDDGFQHLSLRRDLDLVLLDASRPFGNGHLLPWGPLREPVERLERADAFLLTRSGRRDSSRRLPGFLKKRFPEKPLFQSDHLPDRVVFPFDDGSSGPETLKGRRVAAFAGIARPDLFRETLQGLGAEVVLFRGFRDHHAFRNDEINDLVRQGERLRADFLLTTEKDWVRLESLAPRNPGIGYLTVRFALSEGEEAFFGMVKAAAQRTLGY